MSDIWKDVDRVLADALDLPEASRAAFVDAACAGRPDVAEEVRSLLAQHLHGGPLDMLDGPEVEAGDDLHGRRIGPYRLLCEIGRGGMGSVWLAERDDQEFQKRVAVKLLAAGLPASEAVRRFREERQILASLEHPNIARLLDAGRSVEGWRYIVMEYVDGVPIETYCRTRNLSVRDRVALLQIVASTVHFSHQHLVVHRDLKPANILVTADGTPRLLDFGVAKILSPGGGSPPATVPALQLMTPAYASPEQLRGLPATTSSDVYSLGVLCHELLTGALPDRAGTGDTRVTGTLADRDLHAIVRKAIRELPADRYASAEELAADLGRFLSNRPVAARQTTLSYTVRKFASRHRGAVAATVVAAVTAAAGLAAVVWQSRVARQERRVAEQRFNDVRGLARSMLFDVYDRLAMLPGSTEARQTLVGEVLRYLDRLLKEGSVDPSLALEIAEAYLRVGQVQFNLNTSNLGDTEGARASYRTARRILAEQVGTAGPTPTLERLLARAHLSESEVLLYQQKLTEAKASILEALKIRERLAASGSAEDQRGLAGAYLQLGFALDIADKDGSLDAKHKALDIYEALLAAAPADRDLQRNVALTCKTIGATLSDMHRRAEAETIYRRALALDESRLAAEPNSAMTRMDVSFDLSSLATALTNQHRYEEAIEYWKRTIEIRRALADADPRDMRARGRLAFALKGSGSTRMKLDDYGGALEDLRAALAPIDALLSVDPGDRLALSYAAETLDNIAASEQRLIRPGTPPAAASARRRRACESLTRAVTYYDRIGNVPREKARADAVAARQRLSECERGSR
jgi:eukaryotic-like serine/threonine-protein kinase